MRDAADTSEFSVNEQSRRRTMLPAAGRVVMVSGASGGIGNAIAQCLHNKGYSVSLGARNVDKIGPWIGEGD